MSKFWLYFGIVLSCSGIATGLGLFLIITYFWDDIKKLIQNNSNNYFNSFTDPIDPKFYDKETVDEMK